MRPFLAFTTALALAGLPLSADADEIRQYVDEGVIVLSNVPQKAKRRSAVRPAAGGLIRITARDASDANTRQMPEAYRRLLADACRRHRVPFALGKAVMAAESNFDPDALSRAGAMGLMQLMPGTAEEMGVEDPFDPGQNIEGGVRYLRTLSDLFEGDLERIAAAYNAGPTAVRLAEGVPNYPETQAYVRRVLRFYERFSSEGSPAPDA